MEEITVRKRTLIAILKKTFNVSFSERTQTKAT